MLQFLSQPPSLSSRFRRMTPGWHYSNPLCHPALPLSPPFPLCSAISSRTLFSAQPHYSYLHLLSDATWLSLSLSLSVSVPIFASIYLHLVAVARTLSMTSSFSAPLLSSSWPSFLPSFVSSSLFTSSFLSLLYLFSFPVLQSPPPFFFFPICHLHFLSFLFLSFILLSLPVFSVHIYLLFTLSSSTFSFFPSTSAVFPCMPPLLSFPSPLFLTISSPCFLPLLLLTLSLYLLFFLLLPFSLLALPFPPLARELLSAMITFSYSSNPSCYLFSSPLYRFPFFLWPSPPLFSHLFKPLLWSFCMTASPSPSLLMLLPS